MATYAIGDIQGCYQQFLTLLDAIRFDAGTDRLWIAGDLVNRGPDSLSVLRRVRDLGEAAICVLGNHDLHLVAARYGHRRLSAKDTLDQVLDAPDGDDLVEWLRHRPLLHHDATIATAMVHAGLPPQWSVAAARERARELESVLRDDREVDRFLRHMYGDKPDRWSEDLTGVKRLRFITNAFTRTRYVSEDGRLDFDEKSPPGRQGDGLVPWFEVPGRASVGTLIVFGHWATLQIDGPLDPRHDVLHLDTGCVWGGRLSAERLEDRQRFSVPGWTPER